MKSDAKTAAKPMQSRPKRASFSNCEICPKIPLARRAESIFADQYFSSMLMPSNLARGEKVMACNKLEPFKVL